MLDRPSRSIQRTWDTLAPAYDQLTGVHDHAAWASQLEVWRCAAGSRGQRSLDVGCGTGCQHRRRCSSAATRSSASTSRPGCSRRARARLGAAVALHCHDMRELPAHRRSSTSCGASADAVNFLVEDGDLVDAFAGFRRNLAPGGLVVFDVDTLASSARSTRRCWSCRATERVVIFEGLASGRSRPGRWPRRRRRLEPATAPLWRARARGPPPAPPPAPAIEAALTAAGPAAASPCGAPTARAAATSRSTRSATTRPCTSRGQPRPSRRREVSASDDRRGRPPRGERGRDLEGGLIADRRRPPSGRRRSSAFVRP